MLGFQDFSENFSLQQTLNGIDRAYDSSNTLERYPLSAVDLLKIFTLLDMNCLDDQIFWLSCLLCFRGLLRVCHVTDSAHNILLKNVKVTSEYVSIKIVSSKTDQFGREPFLVYYQKLPGSPLCVHAMIERILNFSDQEFLISHRLGALVFPQPYETIYKRLKNVSSILHLPVERISTHSLRHGGTAMLKFLKMPVSSIMSKGNWKSSAVRRYLHTSTSEQLLLEAVPVNYLSNL